MEKEDKNHDEKKPEKLHIFINGIKFTDEQGVMPTMLGRDLANLVRIPPENADITRKNSDVKIGIDETIHVKNGDHFEVIRRKVEAGF